MESIPYDKRSGKLWFNGEAVDWSDAKIHVLNHGLHYASCVFEGERVYDGEIFKLEEHTERLFYSAKRMGIKIPFNQKQINEIAMLHSSKTYSEATKKTFKLVITGGFSDLFKRSTKNKLVHNKDITIKGLIKISKLIK